MITRKKSCEKGRTIVEMIAYISVLITLTASFAALVRRGFYKYESSTIQQELTDLKKAIATSYTADGNYDNVKLNDLCVNRVGPRPLVPARSCKKKNNVEVCECASQSGRHTFGGSVNIGPSDCKGTGNTSCETFFIEFKNVPKDICIQLGSKSWDTMEGSDLDHMEVNDTSWGWPDSPISTISGAQRLPAQIKDVSQACKDKSTLRWYFN